MTSPSTPKSKHPSMLPVRQQRFCEFIAAGENQTESYLKSYKTENKAGATKRASALMNKQAIIDHIAMLRTKETGAIFATRDFKRAKLYKIMCDEESRPADIIRAIEMDCRMAGHFEPEKLEIEGGKKLLESIAERANHVVSKLNAWANRPRPHGANGNGLANGGSNGNGAAHQRPSAGLALPFRNGDRSPLA